MTTQTFLAQAEEIKLRLRTRILNSTVTVVFLTSFAFGGTVPGRWEKVASLPKGESVIVFLKSGERPDGRLQSLATNELVLERAPGEVSALRKQDSARILSTDIVEDSTRNGTLIGAGTGFGAGFLAAVAWEKSVTASGFRLAEENLGLALLAGAVGTGVGALIGWAIDRSTKTQEVLYRAE